MADRSADLVVREGHVARYFTTDHEWETVLLHPYRALAPGGHLALESRKPGHRESWTAPQASRATYPHPDGGTFESGAQVEQVVSDDDGRQGPVVTTRGYTVLSDGTHLSAPETLRFRS